MNAAPEDLVEFCAVEMEDLVPCGGSLYEHCPTVGSGYGCGWRKCSNGHIIREDGHVMGDKP